MTEKLAKLKQQQEAIRRKIAREKQRLAAQERKDDTRRKILDGALIRNEADRNPEIAALLDQLRRRHLTKPHDRALFGLESLPEKPESKEA